MKWAIVFAFASASWKSTLVVDMVFVVRPERCVVEEVRRYSRAAPSMTANCCAVPSVVADVIEIQQAVAWARAHASWRDDDPPLAQDKTTAAGP